MIDSSSSGFTVGVLWGRVLPLPRSILSWDPCLPVRTGQFFCFKGKSCYLLFRIPGQEEWGRTLLVPSDVWHGISCVDSALWDKLQATRCLSLSALCSAQGAPPPSDCQ